ncbi:hypothetical protein V6N11_045598 [Hibiscus sabdariffa]|uniref:Uncharacterized protein n=1 Tax=Hibiscus sabdariffa TaxID=183260 RepID=A0ABR2Q1F3_9ROSI
MRSYGPGIFGLPTRQNGKERFSSVMTGMSWDSRVCHLHFMLVILYEETSKLSVIHNNEIAFEVEANSVHEKTSLSHSNIQLESIDRRNIALTNYNHTTKWHLNLQI